MTFYVENEVDAVWDFDMEKILQDVIRQTGADVECPYEVEVNLSVTDEAGIRTYNRTYREIDSVTDVLSFPAVDYDAPADFSRVRDNPLSYLNPDTQELVLGDIIVCAQRLRLQAEQYGHSELREFAFLVTHSMLHLFGYDHMQPEEEKEMFALQESILQKLGIGR